MGVYIRRLEQRYIVKQEEIEDMNQTKEPPWLVNILFCYEGETHTGNDSEIKQHFYNTKENSNNKEVYTNGSKSTGTKRGVLPEEASIHTVEMRAIRTMIDTKKGG